MVQDSLHALYQALEILGYFGLELFRSNLGFLEVGRGGLMPRA